MRAVCERFVELVEVRLEIGVGDAPFLDRWCASGKNVCGPGYAQGVRAGFVFLRSKSGNRSELPIHTIVDHGHTHDAVGPSPRPARRRIDEPGSRRDTGCVADKRSLFSRGA